MNVGLRIDVDTFRGTKRGVPDLCRLLDAKSISASFFFSVGPDNMGRHLRRLIRPAFLLKMLRTRAAGLYGWDILFRGTLSPGPLIAKNLARAIRTAARAGHEIGLHAWDHHHWQMHIDDMTADEIRYSLNKGVEALTDILGTPPTCSAVPAWKSNDEVLIAKTDFPFRYNSDCRGHSIFRPLAAGTILDQPQIPVTLPTYDEVIGRNGISNSNYNEYMLSLLHPENLNVLTIHAEVEGIACLRMFERFIDMARSSGVTFVPLSALLDESSPAETAAILPREIPGRQGWVSCQASDAKYNIRPRPRHAGIKSQI